VVFDILVSIKVYKKLHPGIRFYGRLSGVVLIGTVFMCHSFKILVAGFYHGDICGINIYGGIILKIIEYRGKQTASLILCFLSCMMIKTELTVLLSKDISLCRSCFKSIVYIC